jgi:glycerol-3-phosphate dehydrogenase
MSELYDIAIVGGGVNGCGIARDASGRGLKVFLCEQGDLASGTSSNTSKLIHGGLRYLEYCEFRLVREALMEREALWAIAPHIIWPMRFVLPHHKGLRPAWLLRLGLFIYDHLGGRKLLPPTRTLDLSTDPLGKPLKPGAYRRGFEYSDCWVEDSRLVALLARDAANRGAVVRTRTKAVKATRGADAWTLTLRDARTGAQSDIRAKILIGAAGPWIGEFAAATGRNTPAKVRLVQGSHIVVRKLYDHDRCYFFQNADGRIMFVIPYERDFTLIGTTDDDYVGDPAKVVATDADIAYLCKSASEYLASPVTPADVVWKYAGVRPLYDDGAGAAQAATRDYVLDLDVEEGAPLLMIYGGKVTTHRPLAEHALDKLAPYLPSDIQARRGWTRSALPGGDFPVQGFEALVGETKRAYPWLDPVDARRLARAYGAKARVLLGAAKSVEELGRAFGAGLFQAEVDYLMREEWAQEASDVVWRRSKLGLRLSAGQIAALDAYMAERRADPAAA